MCRGWRFFEPSVPGAIAPVPATPEMTQPVGIRNCRLYTLPGDATVQQFEERVSNLEDSVDNLDERVSALEQSGGSEADTKVFPQNIDTSFLNHYRLTVDAGFVPETIDMVFSGGSYSVFHLVRANEDYYAQTGRFVDQDGNTFVVYNGSSDTTKVYIEQESVMVNAGTPVYAVVTGKKIN